MTVIKLTFGRDLKKRQQAEAAIHDIRNFLRTGVLPKEEEYAKWVSLVGSKCFIDERQDLVCYKLTKKNMKPRTLIFAPSAIRNKLIQDAHVSDINGHSAAFKTLNRVRRPFGGQPCRNRWIRSSTNA